MVEIAHELRSDLRAQNVQELVLYITVSDTSSSLAPHELYHVPTYGDERCLNIGCDKTDSLLLSA